MKLIIVICLSILLCACDKLYPIYHTKNTNVAVVGIKEKVINKTPMIKICALSNIREYNFLPGQYCDTYFVVPADTLILQNF